METQHKIWHQNDWEILYETISPINPSEYLYGLRIGTRDHDEDPFVTVLISEYIYGLIKNNLVDVIVNDSSQEPISIYKFGKKIQLRNQNNERSNTMSLENLNKEDMILLKAFLLYAESFKIKTLELSNEFLYNIYKQLKISAKRLNLNLSFLDEDVEQKDENNEIYKYYNLRIKITEILTESGFGTINLEDTKLIVLDHNKELEDELNTYLDTFDGEIYTSLFNALAIGTINTTIYDEEEFEFRRPNKSLKNG